jgi:hypothetical protein
MNKTNFNRIREPDKDMLQKVALFVIRNKKGNVRRAKYILDNFFSDNRYLCMFGMGCQEIQKPQSLRWTENEYKTMVECLENCSIPDHLLDEVISKLSDKDKIKYFNANPHYVDEQIKKKNWGPIMLDLVDPVYSPGIDDKIYLFDIDNINFKVVPEMISSFILEDKTDLEFFNKLKNLRSLVIGNDFNEVITLPQGLKNLEIGINNDESSPIFNQKIFLSEVLESLTVSGDFNQPINLPSSLKIFKIDGENTQMDEDTESRSYWYSAFNQPITLPEGLQSLELGGDFNQPISLPEGLQSLELGGDFNQPISLPEGLQSLSMGYSGGDFNQPIILPQGLQSLSTWGDFNQPISLPKGLQSLKISGKFNQPISLPKGLQSLQFVNYFDFDMDNWYNQPINIPIGLEHIVPEEFRNLIVIDE